MSEATFNEVEGNLPEPLLPIEKKLIGISLGTGIVLLAILAVVSRYLPATF
jgi:hypothetical protein